MKVSAVKCNRCKDIIYSRAGHDYHSCSCGGTSIDGGFHYTKLSWEPEVGFPEAVDLDVNATEKELYQDWNTRANRHGTIPASAQISNQSSGNAVDPAKPSPKRSRKKQVESGSDNSRPVRRKGVGKRSKPDGAK